MGTTNSKPPGPIIMIDQWEILSHSQVNLLHSFLEVHNCVATLTCHGKLLKFGAEKPISSAKPAHFDFFTINFTVWSHIPSTGGNALKKKIGRLFCCCLILIVKLKRCSLLSKQSLKATYKKRFLNPKAYYPQNLPSSYWTTFGLPG
jgi:hypothetical protein